MFVAVIAVEIARIRVIRLSAGRIGDSEYLGTSLLFAALLLGQSLLANFLLVLVEGFTVAGVATVLDSILGCGASAKLEVGQTFLAACADFGVVHSIVSRK